MNTNRYSKVIEKNSKKWFRNPIHHYHSKPHSFPCLALMPYTRCRRNRLCDIDILYDLLAGLVVLVDRTGWFNLLCDSSDILVGIMHITLVIIRFNKPWHLSKHYTNSLINSAIWQVQTVLLLGEYKLISISYYCFHL